MADEQFDIRLVMQAAFEQYNRAISQTVTENQKLVKSQNEVAKSLEGITPAQLRAVRATELLSRANLNNAKAQALQDKSLRDSTASFEKYNKSIQTAAVDNLPRLRYALYDISNAFRNISLSIGVGLGGIVYASATVESAFANVQRTLSSDVGIGRIRELQEELMALTRAMPASFDEIAKVATIGNQLGVADRDIEKFTKTVIQASVAMDMSVDEIALAFGRIGELLDVPASAYDNLGSSIALVGVNSVATEKQIVSVAKEISATAANAGFTAEEVIGLSGAISSLGIAPERARGSLDTYFATLNRVVATGGKDLQNFATVVGVTADELDAMVRAGQGEKVFSGFLKGLADFDNVEATKALDELNLSQLRVSNTLIRLANNQKVYNDALGDARDGYREATELGRQYGIVADTLASRWQILQNALVELGNALGESFRDSLKNIVSGITSIINGITDFVKSPIGQFLANITARIATLVGALSGLIAVLASVKASVLAFRTVMSFVGLEKSVSDVLRLRTAWASLTGWINTSTGALRVFKIALVSTGIGALLVGISWAFEAITTSANDASNAFEAVGRAYVEDFVNKVSTTQSAAFGALLKNLDLVKEATSENDFGDWFKGIGFTTLTDSVRDGLKGIDQQLALMATTSLPAVQDAWNRLQEITGLTNEEMAKYFPEMAAKLKDTGTEVEYVNNQFETLSNLINSQTSDLKNFIRLSDAITGVGDALRETGGDSAEAFTNISAVVDIISQMSPHDNVKANLQAFFDFLVNQAGVSAESLIWLQNIINGIAGSAGGATMNFNSLWSAFTKGANNATKATRGVARQVRTLLDYARDVAQVWERAFNIRFDRRSALDEIITGWREINDRIDEYRRKLASLTADRSIKEYWLQVAEAFGDSLRADTLRAEIADLNKQIEEAQAGASTSLKGNSKGAIQNRKTVMGMVSSYQDYIKALIESGASQKTIQAAIKQSKADFYAQGQALGFSRAELDLYAKAFDDMSKAVKNTPKNVTVKANTDPAQQALNELMAKINKSSGTVKVSTKFDSDKLKEQLNNFFKQNPIKPVDDNGKPVRGGGGIFFRMFQSGGYTGDYATNKIVGAVHGREYVVPAHGVDPRTKLPRLDYIQQLTNGRVGSASAGGRGASSVSASTSAVIEARQMRELIGSLAGQIGVIADPVTIARLANQGNKLMARRGAII